MATKSFDGLSRSDQQVGNEGKVNNHGGDVFRGRRETDSFDE
jgi:hypothetical protein